MKRFHFPLDRVLDWKTVVAQQQQNTLDTLNQEHASMTESLLHLHQKLDEASELTESAQSGHELAMNANYRASLLNDRKSAEAARTNCEKRIQSQSEKFRQAETERRLVSKLRDSSYSKW